MKKILPLFVFTLLSVSLISDIPKVSAQGVGGLVVSPKRITFEGRGRTQEVILANRGNVKKRYRISLVNKKMLEDGKLQDLDESAQPEGDEFFATDVLRYAPRQITLEAKETQKIKVLSRLSGNNPDGEYRSHLLFQEIPDENVAQNADINLSEEELSIQIQTIFGVSIPVILRKGELNFDVQIADPKLRKDQDNHYVDFVVERSGNKSILGTAKVFADGEQIGILKGIAVYLSTPRRKVSIKLNSETITDFVGKDIRIQFGEEEKGDNAPSAEIIFKAT